MKTVPRHSSLEAPSKLKPASSELATVTRRERSGGYERRVGVVVTAKAAQRWVIDPWRRIGNTFDYGSYHICPGLIFQCESDGDVCFIHYQTTLFGNYVRMLIWSLSYSLGLI